VFGRDDRNKSIVTRLPAAALRGHGWSECWDGAQPFENQGNHAAPEQKTAMRYRLLVGNEVAAAVLLPARFGRLHAERLFLAPAGGGEALRGNAEAD
jgi:hypothetical protein